MIVCLAAPALAASTAAAAGAPVATGLLASGMAGIPCAILELPFAFSFATVDLLVCPSKK